MQLNGILHSAQLLSALISSTRKTADESEENGTIAHSNKLWYLINSKHDIMLKTKTKSFLISNESKTREKG